MVNSTMAACTKGGQWGYAFDLFLHGPAPDRAAYNALLHACARSVGQWRAPAEESLPPLPPGNGNVWRKRVLQILKRDDHSEADAPHRRVEALLRHMREEGGESSPDLVSFNSACGVVFQEGGGEAVRREGGEGGERGGDSLKERA